MEKCPFLSFDVSDDPSLKYTSSYSFTLFVPPTPNTPASSSSSPQYISSFGSSQNQATSLTYLSIFSTNNEFTIDRFIGCSVITSMRVDNWMIF